MPAPAIELAPLVIGPSPSWYYGYVQNPDQRLRALVEGPITSPFGPRAPIQTPNGQTGNFHNAIDIAAALGMPCYAPLWGRVLWRASDFAGGNFVILDHSELFGFDVQTVYLHFALPASHLDVGEEVLRGQYVGLIGESGLATGPHLHFGLRLRTVAVDPRPYFSATVTLPKGREVAATDEARIGMFRLEAKALVNLVEHVAQYPVAYGQAIRAVRRELEETRVALGPRDTLSPALRGLWDEAGVLLQTLPILEANPLAYPDLMEFLAEESRQLLSTVS